MLLRRMKMRKFKNLFTIGLAVLTAVSMTASGALADKESNYIDSDDLKEGEVVDVGNGAAAGKVKIKSTSVPIQEITETEEPVAIAIPTVTEKPAATKIPTVTERPERTEKPREEEEYRPHSAESRAREYRYAMEHEIHDGMYMLYCIDKDGSAIFEGVDPNFSDNDRTKIVVPEKMGNHTVKKIKNMLPFSSGSDKKYRNTLFKTVKEVVLPETVESIEVGAFGSLIHLETVNLPEGLVKLCSYPSEYKGDTVVLPKGLKEIGGFGSSSIKKIELPDGLEKIRESAFNGSKLKKIYIPDSVKEIGDGAFCSSYLKEVRLPDHFKNYERLKKVFYDNFLEEITYNGELTDEMIAAFLYTPYMKKYVREHMENGMWIEDGVLILYGSSDENAVIPEGITEIGAGAFYNADITSVQFPSTLNKIGRDAFVETKLKEVFIPANVLTIGQYAFSCDLLKRVEIEDKGQRVSFGDGPFSGDRIDVIILPKNYNAGRLTFGVKELEAIEKGRNAPRSTPRPTVEPDKVKPDKVEADKIEADKIESTPAAMETPEPGSAGVFEIYKTGEDIGITRNGEEIPFRVEKPFIDDSNRTQVPLRVIMEHLGCNVVYDDTEKTVEAAKLGICVTLKIGSEDMMINGEVVKMDTVAQIVDDRTYIPIRYVAEPLGYDVIWQE